MNGASTKLRRSGRQADGSFLSVGSQDSTLKGGVGEPLPLLSLADFPALVAAEKSAAPTRASAREIEKKRQHDAAMRILESDGEMELAEALMEAEMKRPRTEGTKKSPSTPALVAASIIDARRQARRRR